MGLTLSSRLGLSLSGGARPYTFTNAEASDLVARMSVAPSNARKARIDTTVGALKSAGLWSKLDALYMLAAHDAQAARLNWISTSYTLSEVNAPTFTTNAGYAGNGTSSYLESGYNPTTAGGVFTQNSAHMGLWSNSASVTAAADIGNLNTAVVCRTSADLIAVRLNASVSAAPIASTDGSGHFIGSRSGSAAIDEYRNGSSVGRGAASTSAAPSNSTFWIGARNNTAFSARQISVAHWGSALTAAEVTALYDILDQYLNGLSASVSSSWTGAIDSSSVTVSARLTAPSLNAKLQVSTDPSFASVTAESTTTLSRSRVVKATVDGLAASTAYYHRWVIDGVPDAGVVGRFTTTPSAGAASFRFAFASCALTGSQHAVFDTIRTLSPAPLFFAHIGDIHYEDISSVGEATRQAALDSVFSSAKQHQLYREVPTYYMYDDHDYCGDNTDGSAAGRDSAVLTFRSRVPTPPLASSIETDPVYYSYTIGRVLFVMTDLRAARSPVGNTDNSSKTMMGATQKAWFKTLLSDPANAHKLVVWFSTVGWIGGTSGADQFQDHWGYYATERAELADFFKDNGLSGRLAICSGDMHALAYDNGAHANYSSGTLDVKVFQAAPLDQVSVLNAGPFTSGPTYGTGHNFAVMDVADDGSTITATVKGLNSALTEAYSYTFSCTP